MVPTRWRAWVSVSARRPRRTLDDVRVPTRVFGHLQLPRPIGALPCHLYLWPTCRSYTRQPSAELHTIGLAAVAGRRPRVALSVRRAAGPARRVHLAGVSGRPARSHAGRSRAGRDRRRECRASLQTALRQLAGGLSHPLLDLRSDAARPARPDRSGAGFRRRGHRVHHARRHRRRAVTVPWRPIAGTAGPTRRARRTRRRIPRVVLRGVPNVRQEQPAQRAGGRRRAPSCRRRPAPRGTTCRVPFTGTMCPGCLIDTAGSPPMPRRRVGPRRTRGGRRAGAASAPPILCLDAYAAARCLGTQACSRDRCRPTPLVVWTKADLVAATPAAVPGAMRTSSRTRGRAGGAARRRSRAA